MAVLARVMRREMALAKMKSNFVADVSHELKTPLALIHMFGETLQSGRVQSEEKRKELPQDWRARTDVYLDGLVNKRFKGDREALMAALPGDKDMHWNEFVEIREDLLMLILREIEAAGTMLATSD